MAIRDTSNVVNSFTFKHRIPPERYTCRFTEAKYEPSSKGNPMVTLEAEICLPEIVEVNGDKLNIAGTSTNKFYFPLIVLDPKTKERDDKKSDAAYKRYQEFLVRLGFVEEAKVLDDENPFIDLKGVVFDVTLRPEESPSLKDPTPEQRAKGLKYGDPILDADGNEIINYRIAIGEVLGRSSVDVGVSH